MLCAATEICDRGVCIGTCFEGGCGDGQVCTTAGRCVDAGCESMTCPDGERCVGGACVAACDGIVCPAGRECRAGRCVDLCAGAVCDECTVCEGGDCVPHCMYRACATGELVYDLFTTLGLTKPWPAHVTEGIYTAIVTDTGSFRFSNTTPRTHALAGDLIFQGVDPEAVYRRIFATVPLKRVRLLREALDRAGVEVCADRVGVRMGQGGCGEIVLGPVGVLEGIRRQAVYRKKVRPVSPYDQRGGLRQKRVRRVLHEPPAVPAIVKVDGHTAVTQHLQKRRIHGANVGLSGVAAKRLRRVAIGIAVERRGKQTQVPALAFSIHLVTGELLRQPAHLHKTSRRSCTRSRCLRKFFARQPGLRPIVAVAQRAFQLDQRTVVTGRNRRRVEVDGLFETPLGCSIPLVRQPPLMHIAVTHVVPDRRVDVDATVEERLPHPERRHVVGQSLHAIEGRDDDPRGKRRSVQAVLGGADPVGVDRLDVAGIGLAATGRLSPALAAPESLPMVLDFASLAPITLVLVIASLVAGFLAGSERGALLGFGRVEAPEALRARREVVHREDRRAAPRVPEHEDRLRAGAQHGEGPPADLRTFAPRADS